MITEENKTILIHRVKSFLWRFGSYALVSVIGLLAENLNLLELDPKVIALIALVLGEITKWLNTEKK
jgi:hypothetical protein